MTPELSDKLREIIGSKSSFDEFIEAIEIVINGYKGLSLFVEDLGDAKCKYNNHFGSGIFETINQFVRRQGNIQGRKYCAELNASQPYRRMIDGVIHKGRHHITFCNAVIRQGRCNPIGLFICLCIAQRTTITN